LREKKREEKKRAAATIGLRGKKRKKESGISLKPVPACIREGRRRS